MSGLLGAVLFRVSLAVLFACVLDYCHRLAPRQFLVYWALAWWAAAFHSILGLVEPLGVIPSTSGLGALLWSVAVHAFGWSFVAFTFLGMWECAKGRVASRGTKTIIFVVAVALLVGRVSVGGPEAAGIGPQWAVLLLVIGIGVAHAVGAAMVFRARDSWGLGAILLLLAFLFHGVVHISGLSLGAGPFVAFPETPSSVLSAAFVEFAMGLGSLIWFLESQFEETVRTGLPLASDDGADADDGIDLDDGADVDQRTIEELEWEVVDVSARERLRLERDLHDGLGQVLTGIGFLVAQLDRSLTEASPAARGILGEVRALVKSAVKQVAGLARGLSPATVSAQGIYSALQEFAETFEEDFKIRCLVDVDPAIELRDTALSTELFLIAQDAVDGAVRDRGAQNLRIELTGEGQEGVLRVTDDGTIPDGVSDPLPIASRVMVYRARGIGGSLSLTRVGHQTILGCVFPIQRGE